MSLFGLGSIVNPVAMVGNALALGGTYLNYKSQQDTNDTNLKIADNANQANVALWREQAAYNTPSAQMQRLKEAGLSPQLVYGQIADSKMASAPTMMAPRMEAPKADLNMLATYQQVMNMQEQNALIRSQNNEVIKRSKGIDLENAYKAYENKQLMAAGALRSEPPLIKGWRFIQDKIDNYNRWLDTESSKRR